MVNPGLGVSERLALAAVTAHAVRWSTVVQVDGTLISLGHRGQPLGQVMCAALDVTVVTGVEVWLVAALEVCVGPTLPGGVLIPQTAMMTTQSAHTSPPSASPAKQPRIAQAAHSSAANGVVVAVEGELITELGVTAAGVVALGIAMQSQRELMGLSSCASVAMLKNSSPVATR